MIDWRQTDLDDEFLRLCLELDTRQEEINRLEAEMAPFRKQLMAKLVILQLRGESVAVSLHDRKYDLQVTLKTPKRPKPTLRGEESARKLMEAGVPFDIIEQAKVQGKMPKPSITVKRQRRKE